MKVQLEEAAKFKPFKVLPYHKIRIKSTAIDESWLENNQERLNTYVHRLAATCLQDDGIAIAAPQVGIFKRLIVVRDFEDRDNLFDSFTAYINPSFVAAVEHGKSEEMEGCLSVPGRLVSVSRWNRIEAAWNELETNAGALRTVHEEIQDPYMARVLQHEIQHLDGVSIADIEERKKRTKNKKLSKKNKHKRK